MMIGGSLSPVTATARVLVIDDDARLHDLLKSYLVQHGFVVDTALDGERGLAALQSRAYDAVLLDVMMPGIDGLEVCRRIRRTSAVPVVMLTAGTALVRRAGRVVPRDTILEEAGRGDTVVGERTIDVHISHLRQKLAEAGGSPQLIRTVRGIGYQLAKDGDP